MAEDPRDTYDASQSYSEQRAAEDARSTQNNANTILNSADVAIATGNPYAVAAGAAVKAADKITGGASTQALGKVMTKANRTAPGGRSVQRASDKLAESGMGDKIGMAASMKGGGGSGAAKAGEAADKAAKAKQAADNAQKAKQAADQAQKAKQNAENIQRARQNAQNAQQAANKAKAAENAEKGKNASDKAGRVANSAGGGRGGSSPSSSDEDENKGLGKFIGKQLFISILLMFAPFLIIILLFIMIIAMVTGIFNDYGDAFGMSSTLGEDTGGLYFNASSEEQEEFYNRINDVKLSYQAQGKSLDAMKIVAIYHALQAYHVDINYDDVTESVIRNWADSMFDGNTYSETTFRNNLENSIFPQYLPGESAKAYEEMADEVFDYLDRYYNLIGKEMYGSSCASIGNCSYDIKGFSIPGRGNVLKNIQISDLKVRLMECGSPYGNGSDTKAIDQDLVDFEDYVAGVAYAEVGPSANEEVLKAQMVAARSFALARPTSMGNAAGKKLEQENGQWVLQIASCVSDQVFCNIDLGCSYMGGGDGQGGICRSGKVAGAVRTRDPLPEDHAIRRAAAETQGEVLVNAQGYIISTGYKSSDQKSWDSLAAQGLNYKQILLQKYNSADRNYGATDIQKASCNNTGSSSCISTGEFASWKQGDPQWGGVPMGSSGKTVSQIGCLVTSISMLVAKSGVPTNVNPWNPGTFVQFLNQHGGINSGGNYVWASVTQAAPSFHYVGQVDLAGYDRQTKLNKIKSVVSQEGVYAVVEVKGNTGQHWVAIDSVTGDTINMMDPSTNSTDMWAQYNWTNTSILQYYKVS